MDIPLKNSWLFPVIQAFHLIGLVVLVGSIATVDLRLLGFGDRGPAVSQLVRNLERWTTAGIFLVVVTGPLMFWSDTGRYLHNPAFLLKMLLLLIALLFHFTIHQQVIHMENGGRTRQRFAGLLSLVLWSLVILSGRAIADFDLSSF